MNDNASVIPRQAASTLLSLAKGFPIVAVTGPRQSGKTTLVQAVFPEKPYVSLEEPDKLDFAVSDPRGFLRNYPEGAVIDEAQRFPELFSYLQAFVDRIKKSGLFILTGSQQFGLLSKISQSLAGRTGLVQLLPFSLQELTAARVRLSAPSAQIYKGLYPPIYDRKLSPDQWYANYVLTYLERDVRNLLNVRNLSSFQKFLRMCAGRSGQLLNLSSLASDCGITHNTALSWLSVLEASYIVFLLRPHHKNFGKRLVKSPKIYFYDCGLAAWLLNIQGSVHLAIHPQRGGLFENLIISELIKDRFNRGLTSNLYFWRNNLGDEIDVVIDQGTRLVPVEIKSGETLNPDYFRGLKKWKKMTSDREAPSYLVYGGGEHLVSEGISIVPWNRTAEFINTKAS
jgi:predicted AAA+ superfamily ATPase